MESDAHGASGCHARARARLLRVGVLLVPAGNELVELRRGRPVERVDLFTGCALRFRAAAAANSGSRFPGVGGRRGRSAAVRGGRAGAARAGAGGGAARIGVLPDRDRRRRRVPAPSGQRATARGERSFRSTRRARRAARTTALTKVGARPWARQARARRPDPRPPSRAAPSERASRTAPASAAPSELRAQPDRGGTEHERDNDERGPRTPKNHGNRCSPHFHEAKAGSTPGCHRLRESDLAVPGRFITLTVVGGNRNGHGLRTARHHERNALARVGERCGRHLHRRRHRMRPADAHRSPTSRSVSRRSSGT